MRINIIIIFLIAVFLFDNKTNEETFTYDKYEVMETGNFLTAAIDSLSSRTTYLAYCNTQTVIKKYNKDALLINTYTYNFTFSATGRLYYLQSNHLILSDTTSYIISLEQDALDVGEFTTLAAKTTTAASIRTTLVSFFDGSFVIGFENGVTAVLEKYTASKVGCFYVDNSGATKVNIYDSSLSFYSTVEVSTSSSISEGHLATSVSDAYDSILFTYLNNNKLYGKILKFDGTTLTQDKPSTGSTALLNDCAPSVQYVDVQMMAVNNFMTVCRANTNTNNLSFLKLDYSSGLVIKTNSDIIKTFDLKKTVTYSHLIAGMICDLICNSLAGPRKRLETLIKKMKYKENFRENAYEILSNMKRVNMFSLFVYLF